MNVARNCILMIHFVLINHFVRQISKDFCYLVSFFGSLIFVEFSNKKLFTEYLTLKFSLIFQFSKGRKTWLTLKLSTLFE